MPRASTPRFPIGDLDARTATRLVGAAGDVVLVIDGKGTIVDVVAHDAELAAKARHDWLGRSWLQTVTVESRDKVEAMLRDAAAVAAAATAAPARWRQVNHPVDGGDDLPLQYTAVRIAGDAAGAPSTDRYLAVGRDLRATVALQRRLVDAQQAMEREYWRFREAETRYRHLFETSTEAVLIVDGRTQKVVEANPAARELAASARPRLLGSTLAQLFDDGDAERLQDLLAAARSVGRQESTRARLAGGAEVSVSVSVFRQDQSTYALVRMMPAPADAAATAARGGKGRRATAGAADADMTAETALLRAYAQNAPDGLVFCDPGGRVLAANRAFLALAQLSAEEQARGRALDRWVGRTGVELGVLIKNLRERGSVGLFVTTLRGEYGGQAEVEISAAVLDPAGGALAFALRDVGRRPKAEPPSGVPPMPRSAGELTELVGRTPLKDIVAETTDLIEQLCIETALEMTHDNRASAALLLGLSRQSLYVKLRRYGLGNLGSEEDGTA